MPRSLFSVHPRILMDLPRPPPRLIPRSPWNFYQFLSSDVPRSSFLKFPEDPDDSSSLFLHRIFIVFLRDCLPYSSLFFSPPPVLTSSISYFLPPSAIVLLPPAWSLLLPPPCPVSPRIYSSLVASLCPFASSLASSFFPLRQPGDLQRFPRATSSLYAPVEDPDER